MKENVTYDKKLTWDIFVNKSANEALQEIYDHANNISLKSRLWYWRSAKRKKRFSLVFRVMIFILLVCGVVLPILAGLINDIDTRLKFTQFGVAALAAAGLLQVADRIFGFSSGWIRYISTVMAMEDLSRRFELDWANYIISKSGSLSDIDKKPLFDIAKKFEDDIYTKQKEETDKWVIEFNEGNALLSELIKSQREAAEKTNSEEKEKKKNLEPGGLELTLTHTNAASPVKIRIDNQADEIFTGTVWSKIGLMPGLHEVHLVTSTPNPVTQKFAVNIQPGAIYKTEITI